MIKDISPTKSEETTFRIRYTVWKTLNEETLSKEEKKFALRFWVNDKRRGKEYDPMKLCHHLHKANTGGAESPKPKPTPAPAPTP